MDRLRRRLTTFLSLGSLTASVRRAYAENLPISDMSDNSKGAADEKSAPNQIIETFSLSYELTGAGWAHAKVSVGSATHDTAVSYLTRDPLGSLAQVLIEYIWPQDSTYFAVANRISKVDVEELRGRDFTWEDEPGGWKWSLRPHGKEAVKVKVELRSSPAGSGPLVNSICSLRQMADACTASIEGLLIKHGIAGYRLKWVDGDLPLAQYLLLKRWLRSSRYVAKAAEGGTWQEDIAALRQLGE